jgi:hypothetical protein
MALVGWGGALHRELDVLNALDRLLARVVFRKPVRQTWRIQRS